MLISKSKMFKTFWILTSIVLLASATVDISKLQEFEEYQSSRMNLYCGHRIDPIVTLV